MAKTPFAAPLGSGTTYAVPAGKQAVFQACYKGATNTSSTLTINGVAVARFFNEEGSGAGFFNVAGLTADAGWIVSGTDIGLSGFLYDKV